MGVIALASKTVIFPVNTFQPPERMLRSKAQINQIQISTFPSFSKQKQHAVEHFSFHRGDNNLFQKIKKKETVSLRVQLRKIMQYYTLSCLDKVCTILAS